MQFITKNILEKLDACRNGINWWIRNGLDGFPVDRLGDIVGEHNGYIKWLNEKLYLKKYEFDQQGNIVRMEDSYGSWEEFQYDERGNMTRMEDSNGGWITFECDGHGNKTRVEDFDGFWMTFQYDEHGNVKSYIDENYGEECFYDEHGNKVRMESSHRSYWKTWEYDDRNIIIKIENAIGRCDNYSYIYTRKESWLLVAKNRIEILRIPLDW